MVDQIKSNQKLECICIVISNVFNTNRYNHVFFQTLLNNNQQQWTNLGLFEEKVLKILENCGNFSYPDDPFCCEIEQSKILRWCEVRRSLFSYFFVFGENVCDIVTISKRNFIVKYYTRLCAYVVVCMYMCVCAWNWRYRSVSVSVCSCILVSSMGGNEKMQCNNV